MCLAWHSQTTSTSHPSALNSSWICSCRARFRTSAFWRGHQLGGPVSSGEAGKVGGRARSAYRICRYGTDCLEDASDFPAAGTLAMCRFSGLRITPDREWSGPGDITADPAVVNAGSAQLFPPPGFTRSIGFVEPHPKKSSPGSITFRSRSRQICRSVTTLRRVRKFDDPIQSGNSGTIARRPAMGINPSLGERFQDLLPDHQRAS